MERGETTKGFPVRGMPYDTDGSGSWTVAGIDIPYTPEEWAALKAGPLRHRHMLHVRIMSVSDGRDNASSRPDPAAVAQTIIGWGCVAIILAVIIAVMVMI